VETSPSQYKREGGYKREATAMDNEEEENKEEKVVRSGERER
jgi:hypothetical protein